MGSEWTEAKLRQMIDDRIEESLNLEYKAAAAVSDKDGIRKDVSSMANADGGLIIYGISEDPANRHFPGDLDPVKREDCSKERLEQVINGIRPRIDGLVVHPVPSLDDANKVCYVVEIPKSETAHQALDHRYYKRFNFQSVPMDDYEVRDVMNRRKVPRVEVTVWLVQKAGEFAVVCKMFNRSAVFAEHATVHLRVPDRWGQRLLAFDSEIYSVQTGEDGYRAWVLKPSMHQRVLYPEGELTFRFPCSVTPIGNWEGVAQPLPWVEYKAFADAMPPLRGKAVLETNF